MGGGEQAIRHLEAEAAGNSDISNRSSDGCDTDRGREKRWPDFFRNDD